MKTDNTSLNATQVGTAEQNLPRNGGSAYELFADVLVQADSVEDFAARYRKYDRYTNLPKEQRAAMLATHREEIELHGITWIAGYDCVEGRTVSWMPSAIQILGPEFQGENGDWVGHPNQGGPE